MKKKRFSGAVAAIAVILVLAGCGGGDASSSSSDATGAGEVYDTGKFSVLVPDGWKAFPVADMWSDEEGAVDPSSLKVFKGAETEPDMFSTCGIDIDCYDPGIGMDTRALYDSYKDISPVKAGGNTWEGFEATMKITEESEFRYTVLSMGGEDSPQLLVSVLMENEGAEIHLNDEDVMAILESIHLD